tara:strand:- start:1142 stop:1327 length:186 start_codon:yes stop_codon:yes gene_type:complete
MPDAVYLFDVDGTFFVGDKNIPGGNDWPLAQRLDTLNDSYWFQVGCYAETRALIEYNELFI